MSATVIFHKSDYDGIFCREIARKFLPDANLIGWEYGEPVPVVPATDQLYMLDISVNGLMDHPNLIWIDHHKSAIEKFPATIPGYRIDGVAACRLAWQWFAGGTGNGHQAMLLPTDVQFKNREVSEPYAVRLAGEYDIWDKRDPDSELFQHGLRSRELTPRVWEDLLDQSIEPTLQIQQSQVMASILFEGGRALQYAKNHENESIIKELGFTLKWEGLTFLACNAARYNSFLFTAGLTPEHDACFGFKWTGKDWSVSLYHAPGKEHHDLSLIASRHGGGGHAGACGFRTMDLPFTAVNTTTKTKEKTMLDTEAVAGILYDAYCVKVGGKAFNGDDLPTWKVFRADQSKRKQSDAWVVVAETAISTLDKYLRT